MRLEEQMKSGLLYREYGHKDPVDQEYEKIIEKQRVNAKEMMFDFNNTRPSDMETRTKILKKLLGSVGKGIYLEPPAHFAYGCNTHIGKNFYANFNFQVVDDCEVFIGDDVMCGPNVLLCVTGHPLNPEYRLGGTQFSLPIHIGNRVWLGAGVMVMPGVTIGDNCVIGAGSIVTKDIPANSLAYGSPCKVIREIGEYDKKYFRKDVLVNDFK